MIITIAGYPGSGKSTIAKLLAKKLKMKHHSTGDYMSKMAEQKGRTLHELTKDALTDKSIDEELDAWQIKAGKTKNNFIIDSRLGFHFIPKSFSIFLDVDEDVAAQRIFNQRRKDEQENTTLKKTKENMKQRIAAEKKRYKTYYRLNPYKKSNYDLVINTTKMMPEEIVEKIFLRLNRM